MKAVIWTDVFQTTIMLAGLLAAIIQVSLSLSLTFERNCRQLSPFDYNYMIHNMASEIVLYLRLIYCRQTATATIDAR